MNVIITFLSLFHPGSKEEEYIDTKTGRTVKGVQTNEAPIAYLLDEIHRSGNDHETKILFIVSEEANKKVEENDSTYDYYQDWLKGICKDHGYSEIETVSIPFGYYMNNRKESTGIMITSDIYKTIYENIQSSDNAYVDFSGGFRDIAYFLTAVIKYMKFNGVELKDIVCSNFNTHKIYHLNYIDDMYSLVSAIDEFTTFGSSNKLRELFKDSENQEVQDLIEAMNQFSESIALCKTQNLKYIIKNINRHTKNLSVAKRQTGHMEVKELMLTYLIPKIREKFYLDLNDNQININTIKWCLDNNFLQQALTIFVDRLPADFFLEHWLYIDKKYIDNCNPKKMSTVYADYLYKELMNPQIKELMDPQIEEMSLKDYLKKIDKEYIVNRDFLKENDEELIRRGEILYDFYLNGRGYEKYGIKPDSRINSLINGMKKEDLCKMLEIELDEPKVNKRIVKASKVDLIENFKKYYSLNTNLRNGRFNENEVRKLFTYYLRVKYYRNRINHASIEEEKRDEISLYRYLKLPENDANPTIKNIKALLYEYISFHESMIKEHKQGD